jgi:hypothetical protein
VTSGAWRDAHVGGRAKGEADRAAGRRQEDWTEEDYYEAGWPHPAAYMSGYRVGRDPDAPARAGAPPPAFALAAAVLAAAAGAWISAGGRRQIRWWRATVSIPPALALARVDEWLREGRARREGFPRAADAPPDARLAAGTVAARLATMTARRWDLRRRGVDRPSTATYLGLALADAIVEEARWRTAVRRWRRGERRS